MPYKYTELLCLTGLYLTPKRVITETGLLDLKEEVGAVSLHFLINFLFSFVKVKLF